MRFCAVDFPTLSTGSKGFPDSRHIPEMVMIGLFTHWAAFITSGQMAVAYWMMHGTKALLPIQNNGELAVLYCFVFLFIASQGGGIWSIDSLMRGGSGRASGR